MRRLAVALLLCCACGSGGGEVVIGDVSGHYLGTVEDTVGRSGELQMMIEEVDGRITGSFFDGSGASGTLEGTRSGDAITMTGTPLFLSGSPGGCASDSTAEIDSGPTLRATYRTFLCQEPSAFSRPSGTFEVTRLEHFEP
jgi:hypothetical protein